MPTILDAEFGEIVIRKSHLSKSFRVSVAPNGQLRVSAPSFAPLFSIKRMIASSRTELRKLVEAHPRLQFENGMIIGKSHSIHKVEAESVSVSKRGQQIIVQMPGDNMNTPVVSSPLRAVVIAALRTESKHYLPRRLSHIAKEYGYSYEKIRFSHAGSRWGSCSSSGTISLNIALMNLPFEIIDYVLIHELAHTKELNHSTAFWKLVEAADKDYRKHRAILKNHSPSV